MHRILTLSAVIFSLIDLDGNGEVDVQELLSFFKKFFSTLEKKSHWFVHIAKYWLGHTDGQTKMNGYCLTKERWECLEKHLVRVFKAIDKNGNGVIEFSEFMNAVEDPDNPLGMLVMNAKPTPISTFPQSQTHTKPHIKSKMAQWRKNSI